MGLTRVDGRIATAPPPTAPQPGIGLNEENLLIQSPTVIEAQLEEQFHPELLAKQPQTNQERMRPMKAPSLSQSLTPSSGFDNPPSS